MLEEVGKSEEGRPLYAVTVNNPKTGPALVQAGDLRRRQHPRQRDPGRRDLPSTCSITCSATTARTRRSPGSSTRSVFYVVPVVNVDGRWHFFHDANTPSSNRSLRIPSDDDHDGLVDEDFPDDLDGDGNICMMRKKDPYGAYKTDPEDPRLMVPVKPGEKGEWTILGEEGIDNDGDGLINEDAEGYVDPNRQLGLRLGAGVRPERLRRLPLPGGRPQGPGPLDADEDQHLHGLDLPQFRRHVPPRAEPQGRRRIPAARTSPSTTIIGKQAERITPGYKYMISWKDLYTTYGDSLEWLCQTMGAYGYTGEVYQSASEAFKGTSEKKTEPTPAASGEEGPRGFLFGDMADRERLKYNDNLTQGELYKPWKPFKHPAYGDIEIGGWVKMSSRLGPPVHAQGPRPPQRHGRPLLGQAHARGRARGDRGQEARRRPLPRPDPAGQRQRHADDELPGPEDPDLSQGHAQGLGPGGQGRGRRDAHRPLHRPGRLQESTGRTSSSWSSPASARRNTSSSSQGKGEVTVRYESRHGGTLEKKVKLD